VSCLRIENLRVAFGKTEILRGVNLSIEKSKTLGIVGESGCGKSMTGLAVMRLIPQGGEITGGKIYLDDVEVTALSEKQMRKLRGGDIAMVFQDPFTSLNPSMRVGDQIAEAVILHQKVDIKTAKQKAIEQLADVKVPSPETSAKKFPHQMSGGQRQRVMLAMAFACRPKLLIADEPTTALDVTLQAQILALIKELQEKYQTAVMLISHDIGVIGTISDDVAVYYAGKVVEIGTTNEVLSNPKHPYTIGLLESMPTAKSGKRLSSIMGQPPDMRTLSRSCSFAPRCSKRFEKCETEPELIAISHNRQSACWLVESQQTK
jgi:oligopeptide/dipeptide ABC transporter ATP-binding protein